MSAAVAPCSRDPRLRPDPLPTDPRLHTSSAVHQTAVVLPTQAKPSSAAAVHQPDTAAHVEMAANSGAVENIFDLLLKDLSQMKSESDAAPSRAAADGGTVDVKPDGISTAAAAQSSSPQDLLLVNPPPHSDSHVQSQETVRLIGDLQRASSHSPNRTEGQHLESRQLPDATVRDEADELSCPMDDDRYGDRESRRRGGSKSGRRRASSQDREKVKGDGRRRTDAREKEKDSGPAEKRMRHEKQHYELKNIDSSASLPTDLM